MKRNQLTTKETPFFTREIMFSIFVCDMSDEDETIRMLSPKALLTQEFTFIYAFEITLEHISNHINYTKVLQRLH